MGTLSNLKAALHRTNVNGQVKSTGGYEPHKDVAALVTRAGDVTRLPAVLKRLAHTFIGLTSFKSKYAIECINLITKLMWVLTEKEGTKVMIRAFINTSAKQGHNKPADMQQENNIKTVKTVVKGLGAGTTETALL
ncbi:hypothetical protein CAPTEDRAFT_215655 [Capitella teleta]|uniref:DUF6589 domain-containing protein n=1 Tax=Capitella teleta TaxID=283909 RepID=R7VCF5_CAPTE|nr:hypothetical protein CAPTEDRAFT_215655 [Capitella teleta]|eukprot:ELU13996.1 hypothetical protein CAPTEDRAFT_215655 [Capitella teleta]